MQKALDKNSKTKKSININNSVTNSMISTGFNDVPKLINDLLKNENKERIDELVNIISEEYQEEGYFYIPQLCTIFKEKKYTESLEQFLLEQCGNKMKFSLYVYWIISSYRQQEDIKSKNFLSTIEMSLVNGLSKKNSKDISNKILTDKEIFEENISKEFRANYYNICIKFYQKIKTFCEKLKEFPIKERKNVLNIFLNNQNKKITQLIKRDLIEDTSKLIKGLYRGYILPFNDSENVLDEESFLIVKFNNAYCQCLSTKARVPCKMTFEVVKVKDLKKYDKYILDDLCLNEGRQTEINGSKKISLKEKKINKEENEIKEIKEVKTISLNDFLYKEIKEEENHSSIKINVSIEEEKNSDKKSKFSAKLINLGKQMRSFSLGELSFFRNYNMINMQNKYGNPFGEQWFEISQKIKSTSPYRKFPSHTIKSFIAKSDDDLRQESLAMQLIKMMADIFEKANINLQLTTYEIIITSRTSGLIEFIPDSISIDGLKKKTGSDLNTFYRNFFLHHFKEVQKNFAESLAAYSLVTYLLNIKDRHNGNIMIDIQGRIIHIDFGFILGISPGNVGFETAPFKMTKEYVNLLDGINSEMYKYFLSILTKGFLEIRKYYDSFVKIIEITGKKSDMPCFAGRDIKIVIRDFVSRFHLDKNEKEINELMVLLAKNSINSWRTYQYDVFQQLTNGIKP